MAKHYYNPPPQASLISKKDIGAQSSKMTEENQQALSEGERGKEKGHTGKDGIHYWKH